MKQITAIIVFLLCASAVTAQPNFWGGGTSRQAISDSLATVKNFAGIAFDNNAVETTIVQKEGYEQIDLFVDDGANVVSTSDAANNRIIVGAAGTYEIFFFMSPGGVGTNKTYEFDAFGISQNSYDVGFATAANPVVISSVGHGFSDDDRIKITGVGGMTDINGRIFTVASSTDSTYTLDVDNGDDVNGSGFGSWSSAGNAALAIKLNHVHAQRKFANQDVGSASGGYYINLLIDHNIELWVKGTTDATNVLIEQCSFMISRKN